MNLFIWYWLFVVVIAVLYAALMVWFMVGWNNLKYIAPDNVVLQTKVTVIVPFFNEAESIAACLKGIVYQKIQTSEIKILAVNDGSTDKSVAIVEAMSKDYNRLTLLNSTGKGKKEAIACAVEAAQSELIVITDADCTYGPNWLSSLVSYYEKYTPGMIIGPVMLDVGRGFFQRFQLLEFNSLIMTTGGAAGIGHPIMCNGANLAFKKSVFESIDNPMNKDLISGDDVFLMHSIKRETDEEIHFLKSHEAVVKTQAVKGIKPYFKQRERWASKATAYTDADTVFTASIVMGTTLLLVLGLFLLPFNWHFVKPLLFLFIVKNIVDFAFFNASDSFFKHRMPLINVILFEIVYVFYFVLVGLKGILKSKGWKKKRLSSTKK